MPEAVHLAPALERLVEALARLPGYGPRSAQRAAFALLSDPTIAESLSRALSDVKAKVRRCRCCNAWCESEICSVCADPERDDQLLCVVESAADQMALDKSLAWSGRYFVLSGRLSPVDGVGPEAIGLTRLIERIDELMKGRGLREVVVATSYTPEGDATAYYLIEAVKRRWPQLRITRLPRGLPAGIEIEYTDLSTLANAVYGRQQV